VGGGRLVRSVYTPEVELVALGLTGGCVWGEGGRLLPCSFAVVFERVVR
jgi:hypothetical protein